MLVHPKGSRERDFQTLPNLLAREFSKLQQQKLDRKVTMTDTEQQRPTNTN